MALLEGFKIVAIAFTSTISEYLTVSSLMIVKEPWHRCLTMTLFRWQLADVNILTNTEEVEVKLHQFQVFQIKMYPIKTIT